MNVHLDCPGCGRLLRVNQQFAGRTLRCPRCGTAYVAPSPGSSPPPPEPPGRDEPPPDVYRLADDGGSDAIIAAEPPPSTEVTPVPNDPPAEPPPLPSHPPQTYRPPADGAPCPECGEPMAGEAVVCVVCGFNRTTGKRLRTVSHRLAGRWDSGNFPLHVRLVAFALVVGACGLALFYFRMDLEWEPVWLLLPGGAALVGALALGTFNRLTVTTDAQGTPVVLEQLWIVFIPTPPQTINLTGFRTIRLTYRQTGIGARDIPVVLLGCVGCGVVGALLLIYLVRADVFQLEILSRLAPDGEPVLAPLTLYRGRSERMARGIGDALEEIAGLRYG